MDKEGPYLGFHQTLQPEDQRRKLYVAPVRKVGERVSKSKAYGRWKRAFEWNTSISPCLTWVEQAAPPDPETKKLLSRHKRWHLTIGGHSAMPLSWAEHQVLLFDAPLEPVSESDRGLAARSRTSLLYSAAEREELLRTMASWPPALLDGTFLHHVFEAPRIVASRLKIPWSTLEIDWLSQRRRTLIQGMEKAGLLDIAPQRQEPVPGSWLVAGDGGGPEKETPAAADCQGAYAWAAVAPDHRTMTAEGGGVPWQVQGIRPLRNGISICSRRAR